MDAGWGIHYRTRRGGGGCNLRCRRLGRWRPSGEARNFASAVRRESLSCRCTVGSDSEIEEQVLMDVDIAAPRRALDQIERKRQPAFLRRSPIRHERGHVYPASQMRSYCEPRLARAEAWKHWVPCPTQELPQTSSSLHRSAALPAAAQEEGPRDETHSEWRLHLMPPEPWCQLFPRVLLLRVFRGRKTSQSARGRRGLLSEEGETARRSPRGSPRCSWSLGDHPNRTESR